MSNKIVKLENKNPRPRKLPWINVEAQGPPEKADGTVIISYLVSVDEETVVRAYDFAEYNVEHKIWIRHDGEFMDPDVYHIDNWLPVIEP